MKTRHSPNLYEILRSAAGPAGGSKESVPGPATAAAAVVAPPPPPPPPPEVLEPEPVVDYSPAPILEPPPPPVARVVESRLTSPVFAALPTPTVDRAEPAPVAGLGERSLKVTYNTILFGGLVVLGVVFLSFTLGLRTGRGQPEAVPAIPELQAVAPQAPAGPAPKFTIRLIEYRGATSQEYTKAQDAAIRYKNELERLGLREGVVETIGTGTGRRVVLRYGEYADAAAAPARETLKKLQSLKLDRGAREATFARTAQFQTR